MTFSSALLIALHLVAADPNSETTVLRCTNNLGVANLYEVDKRAKTLRLLSLDTVMVMEVTDWALIARIPGPEGKPPMLTMTINRYTLDFYARDFRGQEWSGKCEPAKQQV